MSGLPCFDAAPLVSRTRLRQKSSKCRSPTSSTRAALPPGWASHFGKKVQNAEAQPAQPEQHCLPGWASRNSGHFDFQKNEKKTAFENLLQIKEIRPTFDTFPAFVGRTLWGSETSKPKLVLAMFWLRWASTFSLG